MMIQGNIRQFSLKLLLVVVITGFNYTRINLHENDERSVILENTYKEKGPSQRRHSII